VVSSVYNTIRTTSTYIYNVAHVVNQRNVDVQTRGHQAGSLEEVVVVLLSRSLCLLACKPGRWGREPSVFVDGNQVVADVVVEPVEEDQHDTNSGRHAKDSLVSETVWFQLAVLERADGILHLLVAAVEWRQIQVGRSLGLVHVGVIRPEEIMDDDGSPVPQDTRDIIGVLLVHLALHNRVVDQIRVGQGALADDRVVDRSRV